MKHAFSPTATSDRAEKQQERTLLQLITAAAFGMQVMLLYLVQLYPLYAAGQFDSPMVRNLQYLVWALATPILFLGGWSILQGAWRATQAGTATMDTLVAAGTLAAYGYSVYITLVGGGEAYFDSVAMIVTFITLGRYLEKIGGTQARKDIRHLLQLQPDNAWRQSGGEWTADRGEPAGCPATHPDSPRRTGPRRCQDRAWARRRWMSRCLPAKLPRSTKGRAMKSSPALS